jgi:hypothetical protein
MISPITGIDGPSNCKGELMETKMGVWIDYRKAVIVDLAEEGLQTWTLLTGVPCLPPGWSRSISKNPDCRNV